MRITKRTALLLLSIGLLLSASICAGCVDEERCEDEEEQYEAATEKPVIYIYPEGWECTDDEEDLVQYAKPVIYLQPEKALDVTVQLDYSGTLTSTYPAYNDGWRVLAEPDGTLTDPETGRSYYCLYWEGMSDTTWDFSTGFCVAGEDTATFLESALAQLGLNEREANEFIIYWLPRMEHNAYNKIAFQYETYTDHAVLTVTPEPDTMIRVFMAWEGVDEFCDMVPQELDAPERNGFTVVEWGGSEVVG